MTNIDTAQRTGSVWSGWGFALCALALIMALVQIMGGPFAPQVETSVTLGEMAADIGKSAARSALGLAQPAPEALPWDIDRALRVAVVIAAVAGTVLAMLALVKGEDYRLASFAMALGVSAIAMQFFAWLVLMIVGAIIIAAFLSMIAAWSPFG